MQVDKQGFRSGDVMVTLTSAHIPGALSAIREKGIELRDLTDAGDLSISFRVRQSDMKKLAALAYHRGEKLEIGRHGGLTWRLLGLLHRPVLIIGLLFLLILTLWLPGRILFVQVEGNQLVPDRLIAENASQCGIFFGASTRSVRSEKVKNALLSAVPQLKWAGVNTYGCVAVITVKEREMPEKDEPVGCVSSIIASCDGLIESITAEQGTALCKPGDSVLAGQTLISGYTDGGICIQAGNAKGAVMALTRRSLTVLSPEAYTQRGTRLDSDRKIALILGKKRINFYKGSGILPPTCDRIYSAMYVTLPGGYTLPVCLLWEEWIEYEESDFVAPSGIDISESARQYLLAHTLCGEILHADESISNSEGLTVLVGSYICREQIGITRIEETLDRIWEK